MSAFELRRKWIPSGRASELDATMARLEIELGDKLITRFKGDYEPSSDAIEIPLYGIAEWIAENWWSLLWEPRKNEDAREGRDFSFRHSLMAAQQGFALPNMTIISSGNSIHLRARARHAPFADVRFVNGADAFIPRADVERALKSFVSDVVGQLQKADIHDTDLQDDWNLITNTAGDQELFCKSVGALGISPYAASDALANKLAEYLKALGEELLFDLCLASSKFDLHDSAANAVLAKQAAELCDPADLEVFSKIDPPSDNFDGRAWQVGVEAARRFREKLNIKHDDPQGGNKFFELLSINVRNNNGSPQLDAESAPVLGVSVKEGSKARISLLQRKESQRRFTAARGAYLAWTSREESSSRLLTWAVTRDQQASRAFAAEITAPRAFLREVLRKKDGLSMREKIEKAAGILSIGDDVVNKQALNNGIM